ncbi:MAG: hypothetical protein AAF492_08560 [Verrucomicrobiota bacterium]
MNNYPTKRSLCLAVSIVFAGIFGPHSASAQPGTVTAFQKIDAELPLFTGVVEANDNFGQAVAAIGDLNGDGVTEVAVGAHRDDDGGVDRGAVYILFMSTNGLPMTFQKISSTNGNFTGTLADRDNFGRSVAGIGDVNGDTIPDLAVGATGDNGAGGVDRGAVWILFLNANGTVNGQQKINSAAGGLSATLENQDFFGSSVAGLGDLENDGTIEIVVGANGDDDGPAGSVNRGAVYVLDLDASGMVTHEQKISATEGGLGNVLNDRDQFGDSVAKLSDYDFDGVPEIVVGASRHDVSPSFNDRGAVFVLFLHENGTVKSSQKISHDTGGFERVLEDQDFFGISVAGLGDLDGDGIDDIAVGKSREDGEEVNDGSVYILFMQPNGEVRMGTTNGFHQILPAAPIFGGNLEENDFFGESVTALGDLNGDGHDDLAVGAPGDNAGAANAGAVYVLNLDGNVPSNVVPPVADGGSNQTVCVGESVQIGGSPTASGGNGGPYTISWHPPNGLNDPGASNPVATVTNTKVYQVVVTAGGISATDNVTVTVNPLPIVDAGVDQDILITESVQIGGSPTATGSPPFSFSWSPAGDLSSATTSNPTASPNNTTVFEVTVTDANGCVNTDSVTVVVMDVKTAIEAIIVRLGELASQQADGAPLGDPTIQPTDDGSQRWHRRRCARNIMFAKHKMERASALCAKNPPKVRPALNQMRQALVALVQAYRRDCNNKEEIKAIGFEIVRVGKAIIKLALDDAIAGGAPPERINRIVKTLDRLKQLIEREKYENSIYRDSAYGFEQSSERSEGV